MLSEKYTAHQVVMINHIIYCLFHIEKCLMQVEGGSKAYIKSLQPTNYWERVIIQLNNSYQSDYKPTNIQRNTQIDQQCNDKQYTSKQ